MRPANITCSQGMTVPAVVAAISLLFSACDSSPSRPAVATAAARATNAAAEPPAAAPSVPMPAEAAVEGRPAMAPLTPEEISVTEPDLGTAEPPVQTRLKEQRLAFDRFLATNNTPALRAEAWGRLGLLYFAYQFPTAAAACFTNAVFQAPSDHRAWYGLAECRLEADDYPGAITAMETALRQMDGNPNAGPADQNSARRFLGDVLERQERIPEALSQFETVLVLDRTDVYSQVKAGQLHALTGSGPAAIEYLENALRRAPRNRTILALLAQAYRRNGQPERAETLDSAPDPGDATLAPLVRPDPWRRHAAGLVESPTNLIRQANRLAERGQPLKAITVYEAALRLDPTNNTAGINLASALLRARRPLDARRVTEEISTRGNDSEELRYNLALARARTGAKEEALAVVRKWRQERPDAPLPLQLEAAVHESSGDLGAAQNALEQYLRLRPGAAVITVRLARLQARQGNPEGARKTLEAGFQRSPRNPLLRHELARLLAVNSKTEVREAARAVELMQPLISAKSPLPQLETLILALNSSGDSEAALKRFRELTNSFSQRTNAGLVARLERLRTALTAGKPVYEPWPFALHSDPSDTDETPADDGPDKAP